MDDDSSDTSSGVERTTTDIACSYGRAGMSVFPVHYAPGAQDDKAPMAGYLWQQMATDKVHHIVEDFTQAIIAWGEANVSIAWALGQDGYMAIDLDQSDEPDWWHAVDWAGIINVTKRGQHLIFKNPPGIEPSNSTAQFPSHGWGDVRGAGGYIVIAGPDRPGFDIEYLDHAQPFPRPEWLTEYGGGAQAVSAQAVVEFANAHNTSSDIAAERNKLNGIVAATEQFMATWQGESGNRHDLAQWLLTTVAEESQAGYYPFTAGYIVVRDWWLEVMADEPHRHNREFEAMARWAVGRAQQKAPDPTVDANGDEPQTMSDVITAQRERLTLVDGATWLLDEQTEMAARWGKGAEILWARGESLLLVGPPGVGKTTLMAQIVGGLIGAFEGVLGFPLAPANKVLYLAMDRPRQIQRALGRTFSDEHRECLAEHLLVHRGPLVADLGKRPLLLLETAQEAGLEAGDVVIIDSLKDAAVKLSDDEVGGNLNRAVQFCNAADIDVGALHHQRKGQNSEKPTTLEDVYGNTWITAGSGSVVLLWGEAGSELVELSHLKQPADTVGPLRVEHDHHAGMSRVVRGFDVLAYLRMHPDGVTVAQTAQAEHGVVVSSGSAKWKKTERRLRRLVLDGLAVCTGRVQGTDGAFSAGTYTPL